MDSKVCILMNLFETENPVGCSSIGMETTLVADQHTSLTSTVFVCPWAEGLLRDWTCLPVLLFYQKMIFTSPDNRYRHVSDDFHTSSWCSATCWGLFASYPLFYRNCTIIKICLKLLQCCFCSSSWLIRPFISLSSAHTWKWHSCCWSWWGWWFHSLSLSWYYLLQSCNSHYFAINCSSNFPETKVTSLVFVFVWPKVKNTQFMQKKISKSTHLKSCKQ